MIWTILVIFSFHTNTYGSFINKEDCVVAAQTIEDKADDYGTKAIALCIQEKANK